MPLFAAYDRNNQWLFDFISEHEEKAETLAEAQEEDPAVAKVYLIGED